MNALPSIFRKVLLSSLLAALVVPAAADDAVKLLQKQGAQLDILINDELFATYNYGSDLPKPFLLPVRSAAGVVINRALEDASDPDHPHHKGVWNAVDEVNEIQFWAEKGTIRNERLEFGTSGTDSAVFTAVNSWLNPESGDAELTESAVITILASRLLVYDMTFTAPNRDVTFADTKEGMFGFRVAPSIKEKNGGTVVASDGSETTANCWGRCFSWVDYSGTVDGRTVGVAIMDHPGNFRPSRYHVRDYGLFSISPFGEKAYTNGVSREALVQLKKGESLRLRYAMYFHDGNAKDGGVAAAWDQFVKVTAE
jgi:Methane oxygenase PmoA